MPCFLHHCLDVPFSLNLISLCVCLSSFFSAGLRCLRPFGLSAVFTRLFSQLLRDQSQLPFGSVLPASALLNSLHLGSRKLIQSEWLYPSSIIWLMSMLNVMGRLGFVASSLNTFVVEVLFKKNWFVSLVYCRKRHFQSRRYSCSHTGEAMLINTKHQNKHLVAIIKTPTWQSCTNCCVMKSLAYFFGIIKFFKNIFDLITF